MPASASSLFRATSLATKVEPPIPIPSPYVHGHSHNRPAMRALTAFCLRGAAPGSSQEEREFAFKKFGFEFPVMVGAAPPPPPPPVLRIPF